jgi:hypothetical protein
MRIARGKLCVVVHDRLDLAYMGGSIWRAAQLANYSICADNLEEPLSPLPDGSDCYSPDKSHRPRRNDSGIVRPARSGSGMGLAYLFRFTI